MGRQKASKKTKSQRAREVMCEDLLRHYRDGRAIKKSRQVHIHLLDERTA